MVSRRADAGINAHKNVTYRMQDRKGKSCDYPLNRSIIAAMTARFVRFDGLSSALGIFTP